LVILNCNNDWTILKVMQTSAKWRAVGSPSDYAVNSGSWESLIWSSCGVCTDAGCDGRVGLTLWLRLIDIEPCESLLQLHPVEQSMLFDSGRYIYLMHTGKVKLKLYLELNLYQIYITYYVKSSWQYITIAYH
jgi:hypothetical protein